MEQKETISIVCLNDERKNYLEDNGTLREGEIEKLKNQLNRKMLEIQRMEVFYLNNIYFYSKSEFSSKV